MQDIYKLETHPLALSENMITGDKYRITFLTEGLIRLEYDEEGVFEDRPTQMRAQLVVAVQKGSLAVEMQVEVGQPLGLEAVGVFNFVLVTRAVFEEQTVGKEVFAAGKVGGKETVRVDAVHGRLPPGFVFHHKDSRIQRAGGAHDQ